MYYYGLMPQQQNYTDPYASRLSALQGSNSQRMEIITVNGENGARAFQMPPNSRILLLDENAPLVWLAQTDGAGYKTVVAYNITPYQSESAPDYGSLETRVKRLEEMLNEKSNIGTVKSKQTGATE